MATVVERDVVKGAQPPTPETRPESRPQRLPLGPLKTVHVYWLAGMSCDGCTISVAGATNPGVEGLLLGTVPTMPKGKLGDPYVVVYEGSVADERIAHRLGGYWCAMGVETITATEDGEGSHPVP